MNTQIEKRYFPNLDATRFIGFLHVFTAHCFFSSSEAIRESGLFSFFQFNIRAGYLGLDYFFVLSSFLLTWIILEERHQTGRFKAVYFLVRRALRLWPAYFIIVLSTYCAVALLPSFFDSVSLPPIIAYLLFHANYYIIAHGQDFLYLLVFLWVVSVEEQFYVSWAVLMKYAYRYFWAIITLLVLISVIFRFIYFDDEPNLWFNTLSLLGNFATGAAIAYLCFYKNTFRTFFEDLPSKYYALAYLIYVPVVVFYFGWADSRLGIAFEKLIFCGLFAIIILEQSFAKHAFLRFRKIEWVNYLGRISLGLYCYHGVVITFYKMFAEKYHLEQNVWQVFIINPLAILVLTILLALLSFEMLEKRLHDFRKKFY
ncbi:MAG: acyltransferase family protein [Flavobacteriales bacterium]